MGELGRKLVAELKFKTSRSSGPGGQHANKTSSRVELIFNIIESESFGEVRRLRLLNNLKQYIDKSGCLHLTEEGDRSQHLNKEVVINRFLKLIDQALIVPKKRRATKPSKGSVKRRVDNKKRRSQIKRGRRGQWE